MKKLLKKIHFHQPDEMEQSILLKAQRNSYLFLVAALLIWSLYESCRVYAGRSRLNPLPCLLLSTAAIIQAFSRLILTRNAVKDDEDSRETGPLIKIVVLACAAIAAAASAGAAIALMGVRT